MPALNRTKSRNHGTIAKMSKFVNKAAVERMIKKKGKDVIERNMNDKGDLSWQYSNLDKSHDTEGSQAES